jgi:hypothetical protein
VVFEIAGVGAEANPVGYIRATQFALGTDRRVLIAVRPTVRQFLALAHPAGKAGGADGLRFGRLWHIANSFLQPTVRDRMAPVPSMQLEVVAMERSDSSRNIKFVPLEDWPAVCAALSGAFLGVCPTCRCGTAVCLCESLTNW